MEPLSSPVISYVPRLALQTVKGDVRERFEAAVLFADISGFTRLTETLAEQGAEGLDTLTQALKRCFGGLIDVVRQAGGDVIKFAGDALLVIWSGAETGQPIERLCQRALQCAMQMQRSWRAFKAQSSASLALKIGIGAGEVLNLPLPENLRREAVILGPGVAQALAAEGQAAPGDILLHPELLPRLDAGSWRTEAANDGFARLLAGPDDSLPPIVGEIELDALPPTFLVSALPLSVRARVEAGQASWLAELRQLTVLFVRLAPPAAIDGAESLSAGLGSRLEALMAVMARYEGQLNKLSLDGKGLAALVAFGLPPLFHEDNAVRGLKAALALAESLAALGLTPAIGVTSGRVFCGEVGSAWRREYTMMGDAVNTAARLMQAARPDAPVLCDGATARQAQRQLSFRPLERLRLKGKQEAIEVFAPSVGAQPAGAHPRARLAGRRQELAQLRERMERFVRQPAGCLMLIEGESGMGKTTLMQQLPSLNADLLQLAGSGDPVERLTPYHAWQPIVRAICELNGGLLPERAPQEQRERLETMLGGPAAVPLLNPLLRCDFGESPFSSRLQGQARAEATWEMLEGLLARVLETRPLLLSLEDAHWFDSASAGLLDYLLARGLPLLFVVSSRPQAAAELQENAAFLERLRIVATPLLSLDRLDRGAIAELLAQKLETAPELPEPLVEMVYQQAEGHPFFSEELAYALRDAGHLAVSATGCRLRVPVEKLSELELPGNIEGLILSRLDRLAAADQLVLKVAGVIGRSFEVRVLQDVYPVAGERPRVPIALNQLKSQGLLLPARLEQGELNYTFRHNLTHQAIYRMLLPTQRQDLHRRVARWYESSFRHELPPFFGLLAHHWTQALDSGKSLLYCRKAGRHALENGLYQEALYFLEQARSRIEREGQPDAALWRDLGEASYGLGRMPQAREYLERAVAAMGWPAPPEAALKRHLVKNLLQQVRQRLWLVPERDPLRQDRMRQAALALERLGQIYYLNNEKIRGLSNALVVLNLCQLAGPSPQLARACANIALMASAIGRQGIADSYRRQALEISARFDDPGSRAWAQQVTAMACIGRAGWQEADDSLSEALSLYERVHDSRHRNESLGLLSLVKFMQGRWQASLALSTESMQLARARGDSDLETRGLLALAKLALLSHEATRARELLNRALSLQKRPSQLRIQALALLLRVELGQNPPAAAPLAHEIAALQQASQESITAFDIETLTGRVEYALFAQQGQAAALEAFAGFARRFALGEPRASIYAGWNLARQGKLLQARPHWQQAQTRAEALNMPFEACLAKALLKADALLPLPLLSPEGGPGRRDAGLAERDEG